MADPITYTPSYSFAGFQSGAPAAPLPAIPLDNEFFTLANRIDAIVAAVKDVRRSDGVLKNGIVTVDSLAPGVQSYLQAGVAPTAPWSPGHAYVLNDSVSYQSVVYRCLVAHTASGSFAGDLSAGHWTVSIDLTAAVTDATAARDAAIAAQTAAELARDQAQQIGNATALAISFTPAGNIAANNVQTALQELDGEKAANGHTHTIANTTGLQAALDAKAPLASPALTGTPTAPTATSGMNTTQLATTAFVQGAVATSFAGKADLVSPTFTGVPTAPTATAGTATGQLATTAFVASAVAGFTASLNAKANLASPAFTGSVTAPTRAAGDNSTGVATTAFVQAALAGGLVSDARLGSAVNVVTQTVGPAGFDSDARGYMAAAGHVVTAVVYNSTVNAPQGLVTKPIQKRINGVWATVSG